MPPRRGRGRAAPVPQVPIDGAQLVRDMAVAIQQIARATHNETQIQARSLANRVTVALQAFKKLSPPTFSGGSEPMVAENWLKQVKKGLNVLQIETDLRVTIASYHFSGEAAQWWEMIESTRDVTTMEWDVFEQLFLDKYFPEVMRVAMMEEFLGLEQHDMTVIQYEAKFTSLSRFALELVATEDKKSTWFERGLRETIRSKIIPLKIRVYSELVERAIIIKRSLERTKRFWESKSRPKSSSLQTDSRPMKKQRGIASYSSGQQQVQLMSPASMSGRSSLGQVVCHHCRQSGHYRSECPQLHPTPGRDQRVCYGCGQPGHMMRHCPQTQDTRSVTGSHARPIQSAPAQSGHRPPQPIPSVQGSRPTRGATTGFLGRPSGSQGRGQQGQRIQGRAYAVVPTETPAGPLVVRDFADTRADAGKQIA